MLRAPKFLLYADDILIFAKVCDSNITCLRDILTQYGNILGQVFSPAKSTVYFGSNVSVSLHHRMCRSTGVSIGSLPFDYLGVLIFRGAPKVHHLSRLADSVICKFSRWKGSTLPLVGRKCLINFVIVAFLVHSMMAKGGMGIRSIKILNESFVCKLAWDILRNDSEELCLLNRRYIKMDGTPKTYIMSFSLWGGIRRHWPLLLKGSRWVIDSYSLLSFWMGNRLGYVIVDRIGIPPDYAALLRGRICDFFNDDCCHFNEDFFLKHTDIVRYILDIHDSEDMPMTFVVHHSRGSAGQLGSGLPLSRPTKVQLFGGLYGARSPLLTDCPLLASLVLLSASFVCLPLRLWTTSLLSIRLQDRVGSTVTFILAAISEVDPLIRGGMDGSVSELLIARSLGIPGRTSRRQVPISIRWRSPQAGWYKANVDGSVSSTPGYMYAGVIFHNSRGFFAGAFYTCIGRGYPLEAELVAILHSIIYAHAQGWLFLWVESDSFLAVDTVQKRIPLIPWRLRGLWCRAMQAASDMMIMYSHIF
ncbi:hypothetical protein ACS0TY_023924 [Phlomoides rotata]